MTIPHGAGALYSTTEDLLRWNLALYGGKLLSAASVKKMTTPFKNNYGFGIGISATGGPTRYAHNGGINGFNSFLTYYPEPRDRRRAGERMALRPTILLVLSALALAGTP
jgi:CubicO group peptidase (beta-lactamase class C family)